MFGFSAMQSRSGQPGQLESHVADVAITCITVSYAMLHKLTCLIARITHLVVLCNISEDEYRRPSVYGLIYRYSNAWQLLTTQPLLIAKLAASTASNVANDN